MVGVSREAVKKWESGDDDESNGKSTNPFLPDYRVSIPKDKYEPIYERAKAGESHVAIAADYKVTPQRIGQIVELVKERKKPRRKLGKAGNVPAKEYRCIVIDPPWPAEKIERESRPRQGPKLSYPVMRLDEIEQEVARRLKNRVNESGCHFYLWVTHKFLPNGLQLFDSWVRFIRPKGRASPQSHCRGGKS